MVPIHYEIYMRPNLIDLTFKGSIKIHLDIKEATNVVKCHAAELSVHDIQVNGQDVLESTLCEKDETLTLQLASKLEAGTKAIMTCR